MPFSTDCGLVLKKTFYQDSKLIVSVLTQKEGLITFSVTLGKKTAHRLGCFELGHLLHLELSPFKEHFKLHDAHVIFSPQTLKKDLSHLQLWAKFLDTLHKLLSEGSPSPLFFELLKQGIKALDTQPLKKDISYFIFLKWFQSEGVLPLNLFTGFEQELNTLLTLKRFDQLKPLSPCFFDILDQLIEVQLF
jgi:DNA repair protein RecO